MGSMRAIFVLATILSFATPQVSWTAAALSRDASPSISLTAPGATSQLVRSVVKTEKTVSFGGALLTGLLTGPLLGGSLSSFLGLLCGHEHASCEPGFGY